MNDSLHLPKNLKVHFAGCEQFYDGCLLKSIGVNYVLFTSYIKICETIGIRGVPQYFKSKSPWIDNIPKYVEKNFRHSIIDSGIYTLVYSREVSMRGIKIDFDSWQDAYVDYITSCDFNGTVVEVDCQAMTSPEKAWDLRRKLRKQLPNHRIINVFHIDDKKDGLDKLLDYTDYIAFAFPELRHANHSACQENIIRLAEYAKNKKPEIDIHLLGCTSPMVLKRCSFCTSCDSVSHKYPLKVGQLLNRHTSKISLSSRKEYFERFREKLAKLLAENCDKTTFTDRQLLYLLENLGYFALYKDYYSALCGSQD